MGDRLFSKGLIPEDTDRNRTERRRACDPEEDHDSEREAEALAKGRISETLQTIGDHLDRALSSLQRMERKLGDFTR